MILDPIGMEYRPQDACPGGGGFLFLGIGWEMGLSCGGSLLVAGVFGGFALVIRGLFRFDVGRDASRVVGEVVNLPSLLIRVGEVGTGDRPSKLVLVESLLHNMVLLIACLYAPFLNSFIQPNNIISLIIFYIFS